MLSPTSPIHPNIVPRMYCNSTGPSTGKRILSKLFLSDYLPPPTFSLGTAISHAVCLGSSILEHKGSSFYMAVSALPVYVYACYAINYILNKNQPTQEEYNTYLIRLAQNIMANNPVNDVLQLIENIHRAREQRCTIPDILHNELIRGVTDEYLKLADPDMNIVIHLLGYLKNDDHAGPMCSISHIYRYIHQKCVKKMTIQDVRTFCVIVNHYAFCGSSWDIQSQGRTDIFKMLIENELPVLEERYREIRNVLFEIGLGIGEIPQLILQNYHDDESLQKITLCIEQSLFWVTIPEPMLSMLAHFFLENLHCQDVYKAIEYVAVMSCEKQREALVAEMLKRHPSQTKAILAYLQDSAANSQIKDRTMAKKVNTLPFIDRALVFHTLQRAWK